MQVNALLRRSTYTIQELSARADSRGPLMPLPWRHYSLSAIEPLFVRPKGRERCFCVAKAR